jgi:hypothetical protein
MMGAAIDPVEARGEPVGPTPARRSFFAKHARWLLALIVVTSTLVTVAASRRNSTTFDEIVLIAGGARGYALGVFDLAPEHPPLMQYVYGLPAHLMNPALPAEVEVRPPGLGFRYVYARDFFWASGNDGERIAFAARLPAALIGALLVLVTFAFTNARFGPQAGLLGAGLIAFMPDVLGHGMVAYNDLPLALMFLTTMWAADALLRRPTASRGALLGVSFALALGVKFSAVVALPAIGLMTLAEARVRRLDRAWLAGFAQATAVALAACYVALVALYLGDFTLAEMRYGLDFTYGHVSRGHGAPAYLLGNISPEGWWYFFPAAFVLKTPVAFLLLILAATVGFARRGGAEGTPPAGDRMLSSGVRPIVCGAFAFAAALLVSRLAIGFRYALPLLPLFAILTAVGVTRAWMAYGNRLRAAIAVGVLWFAASSLSDYPHFLAYTSEFGAGRDRGDELLLDSSLDWGQGLIDLRSFMREENASSVYLSYFGSALPQGYGIDYVPLASYFPLPAVDRPAGAPPPRFIVVSATNLHGIYLPGDPFARLREVEPYAVLGHTLFVYRVDE